MAVSSVFLRSPANGFSSSKLRPEGQVVWSGGTGPFDVTHQWDTVNTFDSGNLITDTNTGASSGDVGIPPSDMGPAGTTWYYRAQVTDTNDSDTQNSPTHTLDFIDPEDENRYLYVNHNIGTAFVDGDDGDPRDQPRFLYALSNYVVGVPVPYIESITPGAVDQGDTVSIFGFGFDNAARDWSAAARLYDNPDPLAAGATFIALPEVSFDDDYDGNSGLQLLIATVPAGAPSGWVVVINDDGV